MKGGFSAVNVKEITAVIRLLVLILKIFPEDFLNPLL
jgi:hypothetical protein